MDTQNNTEQNLTVELNIPVDPEKPELGTMAKIEPIQTPPEIVSQAPEVSTSNPQEAVTPPIEVQKEEISTEKHPGGRPCAFCTNRERILTISKEYILSGRGEKPRMLYLNELSLNLDIHRDTLWEWANKKKEDGSLAHPEFSDIVKTVEEIQELRLQQRLLGRYNPTGAIFLLKTKHKYIETEKQILAGDKSEPLQIEFIPEKPSSEDVK